MEKAAPMVPDQSLDHGMEKTQNFQPFQKRETSATRKSENSHSALMNWSGVTHP